MGTIEQILVGLARIMQPLFTRIEEGETELLLSELGLELPASVRNNTAFQSVLNAFSQHIRSVFSLVGELRQAADADQTQTIIQKSAELAVKIKALIDDFGIMANSIRNDLGATSLGITQAELDTFLADLPKRLFDYLFVTNIENRLPSMADILELFGVIERTETTGGSNPALPAFTRSVVHLGELTDTVSNPAGQLSELYDWGKPSFTGTKLFPVLSKVLLHSGLPVIYDQAGAPSEINLLFVKAGVDHSQAIPGLFIEPAAGLRFTPDIDISQPGWRFRISILPELGGGARISLFPNGNLDITAPSFPGGSMSAEFNAGFPDKPFDILNFSALSKIEAQSFGAKVTADIDAAGHGKMMLEGALEKGHLLIDLTQADGFISKILPALKIDSGFDLRFGYSSASGFFIEGSSTLEIKLPTHISLGPIEITGLTVSAGLGKNPLPLTAGADFKAALGPLEVVVEDIGFTVFARLLDDNSGNLGRIDLRPGFKPPKGLGLVINAGAVTGGGYLYFDFDRQEYAGALELTIAGFISAKAIGLVSTRMPDGSKGFSMLIIITAEFNPPFQLGYGFTLMAVGGLLGLNRTVLLNPLREGVRTGAVNSIMFPQNVIANAPRIISDLKTIFPPYEGRFLIGPMGKLGWGTPTLISLSLGVIIEIPGNIAILGVLKIALPEERVPLVQIQVAFVGTIDFDKKMITFDASLYQSFLLGMPLEGDMAVRLKYGDNPDFILTVGGFHPSYTPPPLALPTLRRLSLNILNKDNAKIRVECYQAVTSNTVQFGAKAELYFGFSSIAVSGHIAFDALFQFSPFYFIIDVSASVSLKIFSMGVFSIRLKFSLEGPTPWRAKGSGSISFFFFDVSADFDITWGESRNTSLPDIQILPRFVEEIKKPEQWTAVLAANRSLLVSLRQFEAIDGPLPLVLHPAGALEIRQKLLPLTVNIDKIGNQKTSDIRNVSISGASSNGTALRVDHVDEFFASAQYQNMSDADKLSKPSFVKMPGGVRISLDGSHVKNGKMVRKVVEYEVTIIDKEPKRAPKGKFKRFSGTLFTHFLKGNSVSRSALSKGRFVQMQPKSQKLNVVEEGFALAFQDNNKVFDLQSVFANEMLAQTYLNEQISKNPRLRNDIHVISTFELQES
ncbi:hypothetical protein GCM10007423_62340 [Dyadobacter endophyticus]|uniref:DUF6603 domain-containing protein n=1 Tax=Dyadobacter endophyticus TaxID=1749036 RepID=A0ABQ1ZA33_9BACT|nr:DUF6603 domain-containing protein [Dyadobacter endophyticus]GGH55137.1 hypothetical protein GCM10007423_62340 [Dyadobacter endophyticus]